MNEAFDFLGEKNDLGDFMSLTGSSIVELLSKDLEFGKNKFYSLSVDKQLYKKINKYSQNDPLINLLDFLSKNMTKKRNTLQIQKVKLYEKTEFATYKNENDESLKDNKYYKSYGNPNYHQDYKKNQKELNDCIISEKKVENELSNFLKSKNKLENCIKTSTVYEKPNSIDVSAQIKIYADYDIDGLLKLLFTMKDEKDYFLPTNENHLYQYLEDQIFDSINNNMLKVFNKNLDMIPDVVNMKHL